MGQRPLLRDCDCTDKGTAEVRSQRSTHSGSNQRGRAEPDLAQSLLLSPSSPSGVADAGMHEAQDGEVVTLCACTCACRC